MLCRFCGKIVMMTDYFCPGCGARTGRGHGARMRKKSFFGLGCGFNTMHNHGMLHDHSMLHNHGMLHDHGIRHRSTFGRHGGMHGGIHGCGFGHRPMGHTRPGGFGHHGRRF